MNWHEAVVAMQKGGSVYRKSQRTRRLIGESEDGIPIYDCGQESMRLVTAWTQDNRPVMVFQGSDSKVLFVPDADDITATDWAIDA